MEEQGFFYLLCCEGVAKVFAGKNILSFRGLGKKP
jgi:hypothetical protein